MYNKTYAIIASLIFCIITGTLTALYFPTKARVAEGIINGYSQDISTLSGNIQKNRETRKTLETEWRKTDSALSGSINADKERLEKLQLCLEAKTLDCENTDKEKLLSFISSAYADGTVAPANSGAPKRGVDTVVHVDVKELKPEKKVKQSPSVSQQNIPAPIVAKSSSTEKCPKKTILRNGWNDPRVQYAYDLSCGDMDFIKTIEAESRWDVNASGDSHKAFGLCQINRLYNPEMQKQYKALKSDNEKVLFCYSQYKDWVKRGVIKTRLYGYNVRNLPQNKKPFTFK